MTDKGDLNGWPGGLSISEDGGVADHLPGGRLSSWQGKFGKSRFRTLQVLPRTGALTVEVREDRVQLGGSAVTTIRGSLVAGMQSW